jgi:hypothetical protein
LEINVLYAVWRGAFSPEAAAIFAIVLEVVALINQSIYYVLYYNLEDCTGPFDGMILFLWRTLVMLVFPAL